MEFFEAWEAYQVMDINQRHELQQKRKLPLCTEKH